MTHRQSSRPSDERSPRTPGRGPSLNRLRQLSLAVFGWVLPNSYIPMVATGAIYRGPLKGLCVPFLNCHACPVAVFSCPIGMLQHFAAIQVFPFLLIGLVGVTGLAVGRMSCGWLCPFGSLQDILYRIRTPKIHLPRFSSHIKYAVLVGLAVVLPFYTGIHWFSRVCPWGALEAAIPWVLWNPLDPVISEPVIEPGALGWSFYLKLGVLASFLILFVISRRPFCRTSCPMGAIYSLFNSVSVVHLTVDTDRCNGCGHCSESCPMDLRPYETPNSPECTRCLKCSACGRISLALRVR